MSKHRNKQIKGKRVRRVLNAAGDFFHRVGKRVHTTNFGAGVDS